MNNNTRFKHQEMNKSMQYITKINSKIKKIASLPSLGKNYRTCWKFDKVITKINLPVFFWDTVYKPVIDHLLVSTCHTQPSHYSLSLTTEGQQGWVGLWVGGLVKYQNSICMNGHPSYSDLTQLDIKQLSWWATVTLNNASDYRAIGLLSNGLKGYRINGLGLGVL